MTLRSPLHRARPLPPTSLACLLALALLLTLAGCRGRVESGPPDRPPPRPRTPPPPPSPDVRAFVDVTDAAGVRFVHSIGDDHLSNLVEAVGGGAGLLDYDQDGYLDIYVVTGNPAEGVSHQEERETPRQKNRLFRNRGDGTFDDVTDRAGVGFSGFSMGVAVGDYDNDGDPDIYLMNHGPNVLYRNNGDGAFDDVTGKARVAGGHCTVAAGFLDYDRDGWLDLYVGNYIEFDPKYDLYYAPDAMPNPLDYKGQPDFLYRNRGDGTFEDASRILSGIEAPGRGMGVTAADYDQDGWTDIYVANDAMANFLLRNLAGKGFEDVALAAGTAYSEQGESTASMTADFGDCTGDGLLDMIVSDDAYGSLYVNLDNNQFVDETARAGVAAPKGQYVSWGTALVDYDNDADLDIFMVNGDFHHLYPQEDLLLENDGTGKFADVSAQRGEWFHRKRVGRGAAFGDYDNDGDVDVLIMNLNDACALLRNDCAQDTNWLGIRLVGTTSNRDATGALVAVTTGDRVQLVQRKGSYGYLCAHDPRLHLGLGEHEVVDRIEVTWPSGQRQTMQDVAAGQYVTITEPTQAEQ